MLQEEKYKFADRMDRIPESFIREILKVSVNPHVISFAGGLPNPELFPVEKIANAAENVFKKFGKEALQYAVTEGYLPLRAYIAERQSKKEGREILPENVVILNGSQQGLDLAGKLFINHGSNILMEGPTYLGAIQAFSAYQPSFHEVQVHQGGPDQQNFSEKMALIHPSLFYFVPNFQNPTGYSYNIKFREYLAEEASRNNCLLIEDNPYGEIGFEKNDLSNLHALAPENTIYLGSFSKIISPGLRTGWAIGPKKIIEKMTIAKQAGDLHTNFLAQRIIYEYLSQNSLDDHLTTIRNFYGLQAKRMLNLIRQYFPPSVEVNVPTGGMFMWAKLPEGMCAGDLLKSAIQQNVLFVPGENFYVSDFPDKRTLRLNFSNPSPGAMEHGIKILGKIINEMI